MLGTILALVSVIRLCPNFWGCSVLGLNAPRTFHGMRLTTSGFVLFTRMRRRRIRNQQQSTLRMEPSRSNQNELSLTSVEYWSSRNVFRMPSIHPLEKKKDSKPATKRTFVNECGVLEEQKLYQESDGGVPFINILDRGYRICYIHPCETKKDSKPATILPSFRPATIYFKDGTIKEESKPTFVNECGILEEQKLYQESDGLDRGYRCTKSCCENGQFVSQPTFAKSDEKFSGNDVVRSASIAADRSGNERAVRYAKLSSYLKHGNHTNTVRLSDAWEAWIFMTNYMYQSVM
jgi:hypothetical protein